MTRSGSSPSSAAGLLDPELAGRLAGAVGFRDVLVPGYAEVDDAKVVDHLTRLDDLEAFVAATVGPLD